MISYLKGKIKEKGDKYIIVEINSIGYQVFITESFLDKVKIGLEIELYTFLYLRENALELYGFATKEELLFFQHLISISGIGPKSALGVLTLASPKKLKQAILQGRAEILTKVSGIGRKTAERIIIELRGKIEKEKEEKGSPDEEILDALIGLGYSLKEAREAVRKIPLEIIDLKERIKIALKHLSR